MANMTSHLSQLHHSQTVSEHGAYGEHRI